MAGEVAVLEQRHAAQGRQVVDVAVPVTRTRCGLVRKRCCAVQDSAVAMSGFQYFVTVITLVVRQGFPSCQAACVIANDKVQ
jgi:hypothetical protein